MGDGLFRRLEVAVLHGFHELLQFGLVDLRLVGGLLDPLLADPGFLLLEDGFAQ